MVVVDGLNGVNALVSALRTNLDLFQPDTINERLVSTALVRAKDRTSFNAATKNGGDSLVGSTTQAPSLSHRELVSVDRTRNADLLLRKSALVDFTTTLMSFARENKTDLALLVIARVGNAKVCFIGFNDARKLDFILHNAQRIKNLMSPTESRQV